MTDILRDTRALVEHAGAVYRGTPDGPRLAAMHRRLTEPLRVAVAGRVKAGKSTLLNALVSDRIAPTDAGECTRIVTWYADGHTYRVTAEMLPPTASGPSAPVEVDGGQARQLRFERTAAGIEVDLDGLAAEKVARLLVTWPSQGLRAATLIDTPGIGSLSEDIARRTWDVLAPEEDETPADAVLYLLRHLHGNDLDFLRAFHDTEVSRPNPVNAIGVLSRADEVGAARLDAMASARKVATRMSTDPSVRRVVQAVVPVAGLLAETSATLTQGEFDRLRQVAELDKSAADRLLLTADRFVNTRPELDIPPMVREQLLARFGMFGVRLATTMLRHRVVSSATELAAELADRSGIDEVRDVLRSLFLQRRDVLKCRSALLAVEALTRAHPCAGSDRIAAEAERITASAHAFRELRVLSAMRSGWVKGKPEVLAEAERLVGGTGVLPHQRLALPAESDSAALQAAAAESLTRWQRRAENPMTGHQLAAAARVVIQSCEGMLAHLHGWR